MNAARKKGGRRQVANRTPDSPVGKPKEGASPPNRSRRVGTLLLLLTGLIAAWAGLVQFNRSSQERLLRQAEAALSNDPAESERVLRTMLAGDTPRDARTTLLLAGALFQQGKLEEAQPLARRALDLSPDNSAAWRLLAMMDQTNRQIYSAIEAYRQALKYERDPETQRVIRRELIGLHVQAGESAAARQEIETLKAQGADEFVPPLQEAYVLRLEGNSEKAIEPIERSLQREPNSVAAIMLRGTIRLDLKQYDGAAADLERVAQMQPANKEAHYKLAVALRELGFNEKANRHFDLSRQLAEHAAAVVAARSKLAADPNNPQLQRQLLDLQQNPPQ
jgi:tetratricopeptide (TPR) repeat protein